MKTFLILALIAATSVLLPCSPASTDTLPPVLASGIQVKKTMKPFKSEQELVRYFRTLAEKQRRREHAEAKASGGGALAPAQATENSAVKSNRESVTNTQH